jgi:hypothetical protein
MNRLLILPVLLLTLSACETGEGGHVFEASFGRTQYSDDDWNLTFYDNCGMPKGDSVRWIEEENNKFIRFQLGDKDYGRCSSDGKRRSRAPYWERAELKQSSTLASNTKYELTFKIRFVEGFSGNRETFWQMHAYETFFQAKPPIMIKISEGNLIFAAQRVGGGHDVYYSDIKIGDLIGKWNNVKMKFDTSENAEVSLFLNDKEVFLNLPFWVEACGTPHFKFGIYRPGNENGIKLSIIDFDKINVKNIK